jgi:DNA invertase Pin-like site-specific DNA recombinase
LGGLNGRLRVAIYARVSTKDQNCDRQISDLVAYAQRADFAVCEIYKETASGAKNDRQERNRAIDLARNRKVDAVLVTELSRWGRSTLDLLSSLEFLASYGVSLICLSGMDLNLSTPHGKLMTQILAGVAEFERELLRERVRSGVAAARARGKILGRPREDTRDRCAEVNRLRSTGLSERAIGKQLSIGKSTVNKCPRCPDASEGMDW